MNKWVLGILCGVVGIGLWVAIHFIPDNTFVGVASTTKGIALDGIGATDLSITIDTWGTGKPHWRAEIYGDSTGWDSTDAYIYPDLAPMFYKLQGWTLFIYCRTPAHVPPHFHSRLAIEQVAIDDEEIARLLTDNEYAKEGMTREDYR